MAMHVSNSDDVGDDDKILRLRDVEAIVGLKRSTIYRKISEGHFPRQRLLCGSSVGWRNSEIQAWIRQREAL
ncbi:helix-turn-helix transcriptional regulator [Pseudomonas kielensis]|uniref:helix-turn-helix transcriptional regulator n=1 Tax=Pseudomonas kielensis TaxID=2762577 RepID=UPI00389D2A88